MLSAMRVLIAFDKFKNSMTARQACEVARDTLAEMHPDWDLELAPLTDGGEGFAEILTRQYGGELHTVEVLDPLQEKRPAHYGTLPLEKLPQPLRELLGVPAEGTLGIIEMALASGLELVADADRDPWKTTTYGTGQLIGHAADKGCRAILLGVGGSATNDLGLGALQAIGLEVNTAEGQPVPVAPPCTWDNITRLAGEVWPHIPELRIACDVENPVLGPNGATAVYGPQKGLKPEDFNDLERAMGAMAKKLCAHFEKDRTLMSDKGAGAAGGIAFGLTAGCDARLVPGFDLVTAWLGLEGKRKRADLVLTGEGRFDRSSLQGKGPGTVLQASLAEGQQVAVLAGALDEAASAELKDAAQAISPQDMPLEEALRRGPEMLQKALRERF